MNKEKTKLEIAMEIGGVQNPKGASDSEDVALALALLRGKVKYEAAAKAWGISNAVSKSFFVLRKALLNKQIEVREL